jgi:uroporphyrin-III C-methyltransferase/precorrin-2 dehydrogenase/sirohydrochlorin ferrochelatase
MAQGFVSLVGAGPGDPELWTVRGLRRIQDADLVLYDALIDAAALHGLTKAQCFCVGKRAGRASVRQDTIHRLMIRAARQGKRVVRLKGGDPFVFGRGAEEAIALRASGIDFEVVPGVTTAVAAPEIAGIPVTHRGVSTGFLVVAGHSGDALKRAIGGIRPGAVTVVVMMGLASREAIAATLTSCGWAAATPAAIVCGASTPDEWVWTGLLEEMAAASVPAGVAGVLVIGDVVDVREALAVSARPEVMYGGSGRS